MKWAFHDEAKWMVLLYLIPPIIAIALALLIPRLRG
jgi:hypothetical protein